MKGAYLLFTEFFLMQASLCLGMFALAAVSEREVGLFLTGLTATLPAVGLASIIVGAFQWHRGREREP